MYTLTEVIISSIHSFCPVSTSCNDNSSMRSIICLAAVQEKAYTKITTTQFSRRQF